MKSIVFNGANDISVVEAEPLKLEATRVRVRSELSQISPGTEITVLQRKFAAGTHWDNWVRYPFYPGYAVVGHVAESGGDGDDLEVGTRVAVRNGHASEHVIAPDQAHRVPAKVASEDAVWFALAKISFMGVKAGAVGLGSRVLVVGGGPIGQMVVRWCAAAGAERLVLVDRLPERLELARSGGATAVIGKPLDQAGDEIKSACRGAPDVVIDSTGNARVFESALQMAARRGTVVVLGDTGTPSEQHLTSDVILKGLHVVGAHDSHHDAEWTESRIVGLFFSLLERGRFPMAGMNTHTFVPDQASEAYQFLDEHQSETMGVFFDWKEEKGKL